jgi:hypothetical protein
MLRIGQGVLGIICFKDGVMPTYPRTFLIVYISTTQVGVLNVSSVAGKEHKLLFPENRPINNYKPPFMKDSFVKMDSLVYITPIEAAQLRILHNGDCLEPNELNEIINGIKFN